LITQKRCSSDRFVVKQKGKTFAKGITAACNIVSDVMNTRNIQHLQILARLENCPTAAGGA